MAMWFNCMRVAEEGLSAAELERLARTQHTNLNGMRRWGYVAVGPDKLILAPPRRVSRLELSGRRCSERSSDAGGSGSARKRSPGFGDRWPN